MKLLLAVLAMLLAQGPQQPGKASIDGIVVQTTTGDPIEGVQIVLTRDVAAAGSAGGTSNGTPATDPVKITGYGPDGVFSLNTLIPVPALPAAPPTISDAKGMFTFRELDPGLYRLTVTKNGYVRQEYGSRIPAGQGIPIRLSAGQSMKDVTVRLIPTATLSGRIIGEAGRTMAGVVVELDRSAYNPTGQKILQSVAITKTNDLGEYRFPFVTPGRYIVGAGSTAGQAIGLGSGFGDLIWTSPNEYAEASAHAFYPGVSDLSSARTIELPMGVELDGLDFRLGRQQTFRIRGRIVDASGTPPEFAALGIGYASYNGSGGASFGSVGYKKDDGTFEFKDIVPGLYTIIEQGGTSTVVDGMRVSARPGIAVPFSITNSDVDGIVLTIPPSATVLGRLTVDGGNGPSAPDLDKLHVQLRPDTEGPGAVYTSSTSAVLNADGAFELDNVGPASYRVNVFGMPPNYYMKEARFGGADVLNQRLQFDSSRVGTLDIVISPNTARISGIVTDEKQQPVSGARAVLIPDRSRDRTELYKTTVSDENGRVTLSGITPGDYKLYAWDAIEPNSWFDPDVIVQYESKARVIRLGDLSNETVEVHVIPVK